MNLDKYIQDLIAEIVIKVYPRNLGAVDENSNIEIARVFYLDNYAAVETVILGEEGIPGKGNDLKRQRYRSLEQ